MVKYCIFSFQTNTETSTGSRTSNDTTSLVVKQNSNSVWCRDRISRRCTRWCFEMALGPHPRTTSRKFRPINTCPSTRKYKTNSFLYQCTEFYVRFLFNFFSKKNYFFFFFLTKKLVYTKQLKKPDYQNDYDPIWVVP